MGLLAHHNKKALAILLLLLPCCKATRVYQPGGPRKTSTHYEKYNIVVKHSNNTILIIQKDTVNLDSLWHATE